MLTPDYFYGKSDKLIEMYQDLEDWILNDIANRLVAAESLSGTADRELWKLKQMGLHQNEIVKRISELTGKSRNEVRRLLRESVLTSFSDDKTVLERIMNVQPPLQNNAVISAMNAELMKTFGELSNLTNTTMLQTQNDLMNMLNEVDFRVSSGMQSYSSAVCEVLDRYAQNGVVIDYPTGAKRTLESAVRCCIVTSMNQTAAQVTNQYIVEGGIEYVIVSAHMGARHDKKFPEGLQSHDHWQGKVYKIIGSDDDTPNLLESTGYTIDPYTGQGKVVNPLGLHGYNCRHSHRPWDKSLRNPYIDENGNPKIDLHESQEMYEKQQEQRAMERSIRQTKRQLLMKEQEMKGFPNNQDLQNDYDKLSYRLRMQNQKYGTFCAENDLQRQSDRVKVAGFKKEQASKANGRATAYSNTIDKQIEKVENTELQKRKEAINGQIELLNKYGNMTNIMLNGDSDDVLRWGELQKLSNKTDKELLFEMSKSSDNWETIMNMQSDSSMKSFANQLLEVATDEELSALNIWSGETYANINRYLRFNIMVDEISINAAKNIENVLNRITTTEEIIVHRGTGTKHIFEKMKGNWKNDPSVLIGQQFYDKGFVSTSPLKEGGFSGIGESQAELFIRVPKGTHGAYIAHEAHNEAEKEFLLQREYSYRIINAEYRKNPLFPEEKDLKVWCEVILNE